MAGVHMPLAKISSCATISRDCMTNDSRVATEKRTKAAATSNIESHQSLGQCAVRSCLRGATEDSAERPSGESAPTNKGV